MTEQATSFRMGIRFEYLGENVELIIAAPLADGVPDPLATTHADRIGAYFSRAVGEEGWVFVVMGDDVLRILPEGIESEGFVRLGNTADTTAGNLRYTGTDVQARIGGDWVSLVGFGEVDTTFTYDGNDRLDTKTDANGSQTFGYDGNGRLISVTGTGIYKSKTFNYTGDFLTSIDVA